MMIQAKIRCQNDIHMYMAMSALKIPLEFMAKSSKHKYFMSSMMIQVNGRLPQTEITEKSDKIHIYIPVSTLKIPYGICGCYYG
jgi:hypothetical protein